MEVDLTLAEVCPSGSSRDWCGDSPALKRNRRTQYSRCEKYKDSTRVRPHLDNRRWSRCKGIGERGFGDMPSEGEHSSDLPDLPAF